MKSLKELLPQENRVFSLSDFSDKVQLQRFNLKNRIEELTDTPVKFIGVGAGREEIIAR